MRNFCVYGNPCCEGCAGGTVGGVGAGGGGVVVGGVGAGVGSGGCEPAVGCVVVPGVVVPLAASVEVPVRSCA